MISVSPDDNATIRYLPRRVMASAVVPRSRSTKPLWEGNPEVGTIEDDSPEPRALHRRLEHAANGLDFWQLWHAHNSSRAAEDTNARFASKRFRLMC